MWSGGVLAHAVVCAGHPCPGAPGGPMWAATLIPDETRNGHAWLELREPAAPDEIPRVSRGRGSSLAQPNVPRAHSGTSIVLPLQRRASYLKGAMS